MFIVSLLQISIIYKVYGSVIREVDKELYGEQEGEKVFADTSKALHFSKLYFILLPILNLVEVSFGLYLINTMLVNPSLIAAIVLIILVLLQDILILIIFRPRVC